MVKCRNCQTEIEERAKFCPECGAAQERRCEKCGSLVQATARFCLACGGPHGTVPGEASGIAERAYKSPAFILPGAEVLLGETFRGAKLLGATSKVNVAYVNSVGSGQATLLWPETTRLFQNAGFYATGPAASFELAPRTFIESGIIKSRSIQGIFFKGEFYPVGNCEVYLRGDRIIPAPKLDVISDVITPRAATSLESIVEWLAKEGWVRTSATADSFQLQKSGVDVGTAVFLFLLGIVPGLLYVLVKQGRPKILNVRREPLSDTYERLRFSGHGTTAEEVMAIVARAQNHFEIML